MKYKSFNTAFILALLIALPTFVILLSGFAILYRNDFQFSSLTNLGIYSAIYFSLVFLAWKNTYYKTESSILQIKSFGLVNKQIAIGQITTVERLDKKPATPTQPSLYNTNNNISRISIRTKTGGTHFVTPVKETAFLEELRKDNPEIEIMDNTLARKNEQ
ncbi:MAG: PH domain-containing protein [Bacteroidota bacterium]